jgi:hypothetical protein
MKFLPVCTLPDYIQGDIDKAVRDNNPHFSFDRIDMSYDRLQLFSEPLGDPTAEVKLLHANV